MNEGDSVNEISIQQSHKNNHPCLSQSEIIGRSFKSVLKATVKENPNKPIQQIYQEEQSKMFGFF